MQIGVEDLSEALYSRVNTMSFAFPEAFLGSKNEYIQLQYLIDKHPIRSILLIFIKFILEISFRETLIKIFALCGLDISWVINEKEAIYGKNIPDDAINLLEPPSKYRPADRDHVPLLGLDDQVVMEYVVRKATTDPQFASRLKAAFAEAKRSPMKLPTTPPASWADRPAGMTATAFVAKHFAPWINAGVLTLKALTDCDPVLGKAYINRAHRHPEEAVPLVKATNPRFIADPQEAIERYRANGRESKARAKNRDSLTHK